MVELVLVECPICKAKDAVAPPPSLEPDTNGRVARSGCAQCGASLSFDVSGGHPIAGLETDWDNQCRHCGGVMDLGPDYEVAHVPKGIVGAVRNAPLFRMGTCSRCGWQHLVFPASMIKAAREKSARAGH